MGRYLWPIFACSVHYHFFPWNFQFPESAYNIYWVASGYRVWSTVSGTVKSVERIMDCTYIMYHGLYVEKKVSTSMVIIVKPGACQFRSPLLGSLIMPVLYQGFPNERVDIIYTSLSVSPFTQGRPKLNPVICWLVNGLLLLRVTYTRMNSIVLHYISASWIGLKLRDFKQAIRQEEQE